MAIDVYNVPVEQKVYTRQNLFLDNSQETFKDSIGVNIYQDFAYTQINKSSYLAMTTGATVVMNQWAELGVFCSYSVPSVTPIDSQKKDSSKTYKTNLNNYVYCGSTLGFIPWAEHIFHPKFAVDIGLGSASTLTQPCGSESTQCKKGNMLFIVKPAVLLEINMLSFLQWTFGVRYRFQLSTLDSSAYGRSKKIDSDVNWLEFSTGPVFNVR